MVGEPAGGASCAQRGRCAGSLAQALVEHERGRGCWGVISLDHGLGACSHSAGPRMGVGDRDEVEKPDSGRS